MTGKCWEEVLVQAYAESRWHKILEPLCEMLQRWKSGQAGHAEADRALEHAYQDRCALNSLLRLRPDQAAAVIQTTDHDWFVRWIEEHRPAHDTDCP